MKRTLLITLMTVSFSALAQGSWRDGFPAAPYQEMTKARIQKLEGQVPEITEACLTRLEGLLGVEWPSPRRLEIKFDPKLKFDGHAVTSGNGSVSITIRPAPFISGNQPLDVVLCHELVHGLFRRTMSRDDYAKVPRWAREGMAVYLAGQLPHKEATYFVKEGTLNGLEGQHALDDYYEDALAFSFIDQEPGRLKAVLVEVLEGTPIFEAIESHMDLGRKAFLQKAHEFALRHVEEVRAGLPQEIQEAEKLYKRPQTRLASYELFEAYVEKRGFEQPDLALGFALARFARGLMPSHIDGFSMATLRAMIERIPAHFYGSTLGQVRYVLGGIHLRRGEFDKAIALFSTLYELHEEEGMLQRSVPTAMARAYFGKGEWKLVLGWTNDLRGLHISNLTEHLYQRAFSFWRLGEGNKARAALVELRKLGVPVNLEAQVIELEKEINRLK